jgi:hypothetical protein
VRLELEGLAEGAGVPLLEALYLNTRHELAHYGLQEGKLAAAGEGAVGPGPEAVRLFGDPGWGPEDVVAFVHEDEVLLALPGMVGAYLGVRGEAAAALVPRPGAEPVLAGLPWPLRLRGLLDAAPAEDLTATVLASAAWRRPDGAAGTLALAPHGATWYPAAGPWAATTDEEAGGGAGARDAAAEEEVARRARDLLQTARPRRGVLLRLRAGPEGVTAEAASAARLLRSLVTPAAD